MIWNVYIHNINQKTIETYNVFKHSAFEEDVKKLLKKNLGYNKFFEELKRTAMYYFWCKAEHEIVITSWTPHINNTELDRLIDERDAHQCHSYYVDLNIGTKIDIFDQLWLNWEHFSKYVYSFSKNEKKRFAKYENYQMGKDNIKNIF